MESHTPTSKNTTAFFVQAAISFGLALLTTLVAICYLPGDPWPKAFLALATVFLTTSSFTLAKCVRDAQETQYLAARLDQARVDRILAEHNPWQEVA
ncbi:YiaA/YiaB family inner membrane protein [Nocardioides sp. DS6]|uniref:YiaA/YiaB family inner membrane protein n=1 Tax=Nocardioides eburneus TaxID=3231482 RepID=A0ABV3SYH8_9ACTN